MALAILKQIRPANRAPDAAVWINTRGGPLRDLGGPMKKAVEKVCAEPRPGWRRPDRYSFRRTCATALAQVAPKAVVRTILGHGAEVVTDLYIAVTIEDQLAALNRAALLIDGDPATNVVPLVAPVRKTGLKTGVGA